MMMTLKKLGWGYLKDKKGSTAMTVGLTLPVLIGFGVLAVDVGHYYAVKAKVQQAADISGLTILTKMRDEDRVDILEVSTAASRYRGDVIKMAHKNMPAQAKDKAVKTHDILFGKWDFKKKVFNPIGNRYPANAVRIRARLNEGRSNPVKALFGKMFLDHVDLNVSSVAVMPVPPAFHMLSPDASGALEMHGSADIDVFAVQVNSAASDAFRFTARPDGIGTHYVGVTGGATGVTRTDRVHAGVSPVRDFLHDLPAPPHSGCDETNYVTTDLYPTLDEGVYCGGLTITGANEVTLNPGKYIIKGGPLIIDATMANKPIKGDGVLIYLADKKAEVQVHGGHFSIRAMRTGTWAGVALMAARGAHAPPNLWILNTRFYASGIIYLPDTRAEFYRGRFNGVCNYLCFVSDTLKLTDTNINYHFFMTSQSNPFGGTTVVPEEPPVLKKKIRPHLVNKAPFGFF